MLACTVWCTVMCTDVTWHVWSVQPSVLRDTCDVYRCNVTCVMCTFDVWCVHLLVSRDTCDVYSVSRDTFATCQCARRHHCAPIGCVVGVTIQYTLSTLSTISTISTISTHPFCLPRHHVVQSMKQGTMSYIYGGASFIICIKSQIWEEIAKNIGKWNMSLTNPHTLTANQ